METFDATFQSEKTEYIQHKRDKSIDATVTHLLNLMTNDKLEIKLKTLCSHNIIRVFFNKFYSTVNQN